MSEDVPATVVSGDLIGLHFPTSIARHPHPGLIIQVYDFETRDRLASKRGLQAESVKKVLQQAEVLAREFA